MFRIYLLSRRGCDKGEQINPSKGYGIDKRHLSHVEVDPEGVDDPADQDGHPQELEVHHPEEGVRHYSGSCSDQYTCNIAIKEV